jgi:negative regulator of sigma E activity
VERRRVDRDARPEETIDGHKCNVVTLVPKNEEFPNYGKYILYFGTDDQLLWRVEVFDTDGKLYKRTTLRKYDKIGNYSTAMESNVETVPNNTRTDFAFKGVKYDVDVDEKVFAVSNLDR